MYNPLERLDSLRVADLMTRNVIQVRAWQSMCEVAALFREREVSAAPVVDEQDRCVGILSATDFLQRDSACGRYGSVGTRQCACQIQDGSEGEPLRISHPTEDTVGDWMTTAVQSVSAEASLAAAARIMCAQHVHRLIVLDERQSPCGMISTMDIVSAYLNVLDELQIAAPN